MYSLGSGPPAGQGVSRLAGIWVCSGTHRDSKPRSSQATANSAAGMVYSVLKLKIPSCIRPLLPGQRGSNEFEVTIYGGRGAVIARLPGLTGGVFGMTHSALAGDDAVQHGILFTVDADINQIEHIT